MERLQAIEGQPLSLDRYTVELVRRRLAILERRLRPRFGFYSSSVEAVVIQNLIGTVQVTPELVLDIYPKTKPDESWAIAVFDLLVTQKVNIDTLTHRAELVQRPLSDALAAIYAHQLYMALRREGPLIALTPVSTAESRLAGKLEVTTWTRHLTIRPHIFPQKLTRFTIDNPFNKALSWVAHALANRCSDPLLATRLRSLASHLRPGAAEHVHVDPAIAELALPPQWSGYQDAWTTAQAVLRRQSLLRRRGSMDGLSIAIEPWPLLETLLHRSLVAASRIATEVLERQVRTARYGRYELLEPIQSDTGHAPLQRIHRDRRVKPDGVLTLDGRVLACFEAKYSYPIGPKEVRSHLYQLLTSAAATHASAAVLVYPEQSPPVLWRVNGFHGYPRYVAAIGLDLFGYRRRDGDAVRGQILLDVLSEMLPDLPLTRGPEKSAHRVGHVGWVSAVWTTR